MATTPTLTTNSIPCPTSTKTVPGLKVYPTPDWDHLTRGEDYVKNQVMVVPKGGLREKEAKRIFNKLSKFGELKVCTSGNFSYYLIIIKNGMSERKVLESLYADPAVKAASLDTIIHIRPLFRNDENILHPDKEDLKEFRLK